MKKLSNYLFQCNISCSHKTSLSFIIQDIIYQNDVCQVVIALDRSYCYLMCLSKQLSLRNAHVHSMLPPSSYTFDHAMRQLYHTKPITTTISSIFSPLSLAHFRDSCVVTSSDIFSITVFHDAYKLSINHYILIHCFTNPNQKKNINSQQKKVPQLEHQKKHHQLSFKKSSSPEFLTLS